MGLFSVECWHLPRGWNTCKRVHVVQYQNIAKNDTSCCFVPNIWIFAKWIFFLKYHHLSVVDRRLLHFIKAESSTWRGKPYQNKNRCSFINFGEFYLDQRMVKWMVVLPALNMWIFTTRLSVSKSISSHERKIWCLLRGVVFPLVVCADHGISSHRAVILEIIN